MCNRYIPHFSICEIYFLKINYNYSRLKAVKSLTHIHNHLYFALIEITVSQLDNMEASLKK